MGFFYYEKLTYIIIVGKLGTQKSQWYISSPSPMNKEVQGCKFKFKTKGKRRLTSQFQDSQVKKEFYLTQSFVLFRPSPDWIYPAHFREGNVLYSFHHLRFRNTLIDIPEQHLTNYLDILCPSKLTHKISHHNECCNLDLE